MTKVEHTKNHIRAAYRDEEMNLVKAANVLVADAELVLVECKPEEALIVFGKPNQNLKPILISRTEKIEVGGWVYVPDSYEKIMKVGDGQLEISLSRILNPDEEDPKEVFKILALPEHFSPEHLQMIVDGKLSGKVVVECEQHNPSIQNILADDGTMKIKLNPHITIYPVEEKMYTREAFIRKWLGNKDFQYTEQNRDLMRDDLDEVINQALRQPPVISSVAKCPVCLEKMKGIELIHYKCKKCNEYFTN